MVEFPKHTASFFNALEFRTALALRKGGHGCEEQVQQPRQRHVDVTSGAVLAFQWLWSLMNGVSTGRASWGRIQCETGPSRLPIGCRLPTCPTCLPATWGTRWDILLGQSVGWYELSCTVAECEILGGRLKGGRSQDCLPHNLQLSTAANSAEFTNSVMSVSIGVPDEIRCINAFLSASSACLWNRVA